MSPLLAQSRHRSRIAKGPLLTQSEHRFFRYTMFVKAAFQTFCSLVLIFVIFLGDVFTGVVGHQCRRHQSYHCTGGDIDRDRIACLISGE